MKDWMRETEPRLLGTIYRVRRLSIEVFEVDLLCQSTGERLELVQVRENQRDGRCRSVSLPRECWAEVWRILCASSSDGAASPPPIPCSGAPDGSVGGVMSRPVEAEAFDTDGHGA